VQEKGKILQPTYIYLVNHTIKTVTSLNKQTGFRIDFDPKNEYSMCIFNNNKMYVCDKQLFKKTKENENNKFMVKPLPESTDNVIDFKKALEI
jgi:outer membrane lipoprotein-sorting protein